MWHFLLVSNGVTSETLILFWRPWCGILTVSFRSPGLTHLFMDRAFAASWFVLFMRSSARRGYIPLQSPNLKTEILVCCCSNFMVASIYVYSRKSCDGSHFFSPWHLSTSSFLFFFFSLSRFHCAAACILKPGNCRLMLNLISLKHKFVSYKHCGSIVGKMFTYCETTRDLMHSC